MRPCQPLRRWAGAALIAGAFALLGGCATVAHPDPLEPVNRAVFGFNETLDVAVIKPVATAYQRVVPEPARKGVTNFFWNFSDVWSAVNLVLQGRVGEAGINVARFGTNSVLGVFGLFDVASEMGMRRRDEDLGQTLGKWGVQPGAYIVWPLLGPSTVRDSLNIPFAQSFSPMPLFSDASTRWGLSVTQTVNVRAGLLGATGLIDDIALDKYSFVRNAYLQRRRSLVYNGDPPDQDIPPEDDLPDPGRASDPARAPARR